MAHRFQNITGTVGAACLGDGATSTGAFHESLNQAAVEKLPLVLIVADNMYAYSTPTSRQFACEDLVDRAVGYGVQGHSLEGNDLTACLEVVGEAVALARRGCGPQLVVARLLRLCGHGEHDDSHYIDPKFKTAQFGRDCLKVAEEHLLKQNWAEPPILEAWRNETHQQVEDAVAIVQREAGPDLFKEDWHALASTHLIEGQNQP